MSQYLFIGFGIGAFFYPAVFPFIQEHKSLFITALVLLFLFSGKIEDLWHGDR